jgi:hypothetical protein
MERKLKDLNEDDWSNRESLKNERRVVHKVLQKLTRKWHKTHLYFFCIINILSFIS